MHASTDDKLKVPNLAALLVRRPQAHATLLNLFLTLAMKPLGQKHVPDPRNEAPR